MAPVTNQTTDAGLAEELRVFYDRTLLTRLLPNIVWPIFGQPKTMPQREGQTVNWNGFDPLPVATTPLTEGVTPDGSALSMTHLQATPVQVGDFVRVTDVVDLQSPDPVLTNIVELQGEQAAATYDILVRNILMAGTSVHYANGRLSTVTVASTDVVTLTDARKIVRTFSKNKIRKVTSVLNATDGVGTTPIPASFVAICSPETEHDLKGTTGFVPVQEYPGGSAQMIHPDEVGSLDQIRFIKSDQAAVKSAAGAAGIDVHCTIVLGQGAYGIVNLKGLESIFKGYGSGDDPLNQRATMGWKAFFVAKILQELAVIRWEHAVAA